MAFFGAVLMLFKSALCRIKWHQGILVQKATKGGLILHCPEAVVGPLQKNSGTTRHTHLRMGKKAFFPPINLCHIIIKIANTIAMLF